MSPQPTWPTRKHLQTHFVQFSSVHAFALTRSGAPPALSPLACSAPAGTGCMTALSSAGNTSLASIMHDGLLPLIEDGRGYTASIADFDQVIQELQILRDDEATAQGMMKTGTMTTVCSIYI